jgi:geranylgeranyl pyrophosphate synthase
MKSKDSVMLSTKTNVETNEEMFHDYLDDARKFVESELLTHLSRFADLRIYDKIKYVLLSPGKRLRPLLVLLSAQSVGGNREEVTQLALSFELLHTATLVHDDILDQDRYRRNVPTIHEKWSVNEAILVGDAMISLGVNFISDYGPEILKIASETGLTLCDGEYMDVSTTSIELAGVEYLAKIGKKSASLFQAATQCGAIAGGGSDIEVKCLADFGEHYGMAYQLSDDVSDISSTKGGIPRDLRKHRISLPLIHLYKSSSLAEREMLINDLQTLTNKDAAEKEIPLARILKNLETKGSLAFCKEKINEFIDQAIADVKPLRDSDFKFHLIRMAELLRPKERTK